MTTCGAEPDAVDKETTKEKGRYVLALVRWSSHGASKGQNVKSHSTRNVSVILNQIRRLPSDLSVVLPKCWQISKRNQFEIFSTMVWRDA